VCAKLCGGVCVCVFDTKRLCAMVHNGDEYIYITKLMMALPEPPATTRPPKKNPNTAEEVVTKRYGIRFEILSLFGFLKDTV
jgi:hypothetical protein